MKPSGTILVNDYRLEPARLADQRPYPGEALTFLREKGFDVMLLEGTQAAIGLGNYRVANVILLGALSTRLDIPAEAWGRTLQERIPPRLLELNRKAFAAGIEGASAH